MKNLGIKWLFNSILAFFIIVGAALQAVFFYQMCSISSYQEHKFADTIINQVSMTVEKRMETIKSIAQKLSGSQMTVSFLAAQDAAEKQRLLVQCMEYVDILQNGSEETLYAVLVDNNQKYYRLTNNISDMEYQNVCNVYEGYLEAMRNDVQMLDSTYCDFFDYGVTNATELYACSLQDLYVHDYEKLVNVKQGTIIVCTKINVKKLLLGIDDVIEMNVAITNRYNDRRTKISLKEVNSEIAYRKNSMQKISILNTVWELKGTFNMDRVEYTIRNQQWIFLLEVVLVFGFVIFLRWVIDTKIVRPVSEIVQFLNEYEIASRPKYIEVRSVKEIQRVAFHINQLLDNIKQITRKLIQKQQELYEIELYNRQIQLYALQNQVNPHFLYNALECVRGMALMRDMDDVAGVAASLSNIMRYTLSDQQMVSLQQELDVCLQYIGIMQVRYPNAFLVQTDIPTSLADYMILKMTLQPIVENAFNHGRFFRKKDGRLSISARQSDTYLEIIVTDNGKGMKADELRQLNERLTQGDAVYRADGSIGLANISSRIRLQCGDNCGLEIDSLPDCYTTVTIRYKLKKDK